MNDPIKEEVNNGIEFATALYYLKLGYRLSRKGWNGKGQWVSMTPGRTLDISKDNIWTSNVKKAAIENGGTLEMLPYLSLKTAQGKLQIGWLPSQSDLFAHDWFVLSEGKVNEQ